MIFKGILHNNLKLACFVSYLKIINTFFSKNIACLYYNKLSKNLQNGIEMLLDQNSQKNVFIIFSRTAGLLKLLISFLNSLDNLL